MSRFVHHAEAIHRLHKDLNHIPNYENLLELTYRRFIKAGDTVVDVGAHSGRHTLVFAQLVGSTGAVHAFEPLPVAREWIKARGLPPWVSVHAVALSTERGEVTFHYAPERPEESGLRSRILANNSPLVEITVKTQPLDDFISLFSVCRFIKIDAEGGEIGCLQSAAHLISRDRPIITVEYGYPGYSAFGLTKRSLYDLAASFRYVIGDLFGGICQSPAEWDLVCDLCYWDWYLIPEEKAQEWAQALRIA